MKALHALVDELSRSDAPDPAGRRARATEAIGNFAAAAALFGGVADEAGVSNQPWRELFGDACLPALLTESITLAKRNGTRELVFELEIPLRTYHRYAVAAVDPLRNANGALVVCLDITDTAIARALEVDGDALIWSASVAHSGGYEGRRWCDRVKTPWQAAIHPRDLGRWCAIVATVEYGQRAASIDVRIAIDGIHRWHRVRLSSERGFVMCAAVDVHDDHERESARRTLLAELERARENAARADRLRDDFLAVISHELRTPLTTMLLWEKVLRENADNEVSRRDALEAIRRSAAEQAKMFGDLIDYARGASGKLALDLRQIDIVAVMAEATKATFQIAEEKGIELAVRVAKHATVLADAARLRQIIDIMLSNAIRFTGRGGRVSIAIVQTNEHVAIEVRDSGRGLAPDQLERIFEPFAQASSGLTRREGGLGLGLTIARQLLELHHGTLEVASEGLGNGSSFIAKIPSASARVGVAYRKRTRDTQRLDGARLLIVDDDPGVRRGLAVLLGRLGARVETADSASDARARINTSAPQAVICDIAMPDEDGYSFVRSLRHAGVDVPSIALTAFATEEDERLARDAGFDVHLTKPIRLERLVDALSEILSSQRNISTT